MSEWAEYCWVDIHDEEKRAEICGISRDEVRPGVKALMLKEPTEETFAKARARYDAGNWPELYFTRGGTGGMRRKKYLDEAAGRVPSNYWPYEEVGHTGEASKDLALIFGGRSPFDTPKPTRLIERILQIATGKDAIVLDSFAGSGTTAHAVLNANAADGGYRRFILVEMMDYAESITAERVKRVIDGYGVSGN